ncbi:hypothetical protein BDR26DRAFT_861930 [Obelidium mucronatum]|nr:hypothetical protein BDR26DRAFT_861930 [Obelidium mucronatum]
MRPLPCIRCRYYRRKCSLDQPECERCARLGFECEYPKRLVKGRQQQQQQQQYTVSPSPAVSNISSISMSSMTVTQAGVVVLEDDNALGYKPQLPVRTHSTPLQQYLQISDASLLDLENDWNPQVANTKTITATTPATIQTPSLLDSIVNVSETPLIDLQDKEWELQDPDLMPTLEDYFLVYNASTRNGTESPLFFSYDADEFLRTFFKQPPFFRLIQCAMSAYEVHSEGLVTIAFYKRAKKACIRAMNEKPDYKSVQGLYWLVLLVGWMGQPDLGRSFLKTALRLIKALRLDIDPDESPWLHPLTPRQKEDRRRTFWSVYAAVMMENVISNDSIHVPFNSDRMNPPTAVTDPYPIFDAEPLAKPQCELYSVISAIKQHYRTCPKSIHDILASPETAALLSRLNAVHDSMPIDTLLISESPESLTASDYTRFIAQQDKLMSSQAKSENFVYNSESLASICLLNRPILFLTSLKSFNPARLTREVREIVATAVNQSLDASHRLLLLLHFFLDPSCSAVGTGQSLFPYQDKYSPLFEGMVVLWFSYARMDVKWWDVLAGRRRRKLAWVVLRPRMMQVIRFLESVYSSESGGVDKDTGILPPLVACMREMVCDIDVCESRGSETHLHHHFYHHSRGGVDDFHEIEDITLRMKVVSLDGEDETVLKREPKAFLGLLGMSVGTMRWPGPSEESWRLFWKLHS